MKKGFTLIELLAVIIVLAVVALITVPTILDVVDSAKEKSRISSVNSLIDATRLYMSEALLDDSIDLSGNLLDIINNRVKGTKPSEGEIRIDGNDIGIAVKIDGVCYIKDYNDNEIIKTNDEDCTIYKVVEATCYDGEIEIIDDFEINYDGCMVNFNSVFDAEYTEEELDKICKNEEKMNIEDTNIYLKDYIIVLSMFESDISNFINNNIVDVTYESVCQTCFEYQKNIDFDINYDNCMEEFEDDTFCKGQRIVEDGLIVNIYELLDLYVEALIEYVDDGIIENLRYTDGAKITDYLCYEGNELDLPTITNLVTPTSINGLKVNSIGMGAFAEKGLTNITISHGVKTIGLGAFYNNPYKTVDISSTVANISDYAFGKDTLIDNQMINNHTNKRFDWSSITGSDTSNQVFAQGEVIHQNGNITVISDSDFEYEKVPVYEVDYDKCMAFLDSDLDRDSFCNGEYIDFDSGYIDLIGLVELENNIDFISGVTYKEEYQITNYYGGENVVIPASIDGIPVTRIATAAFMKKGLINVDFSKAVNLTDIATAAFAGNQINGELDLSNTKIKSLGGIIVGVFEENQITSIKLPTTLTTINYCAFYKNQISGELNLTNLTNLTSIGQNAFRDNQITSVKLPTTLTIIDFYAFSHNQISGELDLSNTNLTSISHRVFWDNQITSVKLPATLTIIDFYAFSHNQISGELDLSNLTNLTSIGQNAFRDNQITSVKLPSSVTTINWGSFGNNSNLTLIEIDNTKDAIEGAPWGADNATITWLRDN